MNGAAYPMVLKVGKSPTKTVESPITTMVTRNVYLRPTRSPMRPKMIAPKGRTKKPAAYVANAARSAAV